MIRKKFNGEIYRLLNTYSRKSDARKEAERWIDGGRKIRIVKVKQGYEVYLRYIFYKP